MDAHCYPTTWTRRLIARTSRGLVAVLLAQMLLIGCTDARDPVGPPAVPRGPSLLLVSSPNTFTQVSGGGYHTCALRGDGVIECWGSTNSYGQAPATKQAASGTFTQVSTGLYYTCALRGDGVAECWGFTGYGQAPATRAAASGAFTQVSAAHYHTCAVRSDGVVECWGYNISGQAPATRAPASGAFTQVSAGEYHTCALRADHVVECWGDNGSGEAPATRTAASGAFTQVSAGAAHTCALRDDGVVECWGNDYSGDAPATRTATSGTFTQLSAGAYHNCALRTDGVVECWGSDDYGRAPATKTAASGAFTQVSATWWSGCALRADGVVECWGLNYNGEAPATKTAGSTTVHVPPTATFSATPGSVTAGQSFTLALSGAQVPGHPEATQFTYAFDCGDGAGYGAFGSTASATCATAAAGARTVKGKVRDQDLDAAEYTATVQVTVPPDITPPVITASVSGTLGTNGWYRSTVIVSWSAADAESAVTSPPCAPTTISADTPGQLVTCSATSAGGTDTKSVTVKRDATAPTLAPTVSPNPVLLNGTATAAPNASDALSGLAVSSCAAPNTSSVGSKTLSCSASDNAGNSATASAGYTVTYQFVGFGAPVSNGGVLNVANSGQNIALKWRLLDANGAPVTNLASVTVTAVALACSAASPVNPVEEYAASASGLQNLGGGAYQYNWATPRSYDGTCQTVYLNLGEGITRTALFQFTR